MTISLSLPLIIRAMTISLPLIVPVWLIGWLGTALLWAITCFLLTPEARWPSTIDLGLREGWRYWMFMLSLLIVVWVEFALHHCRVLARKVMEEHPPQWYFWKFVHNLLIHPLLAFPYEPKWVQRAHDWTAQRCKGGG